MSFHKNSPFSGTLDDLTVEDILSEFGVENFQALSTALDLCSRASETVTDYLDYDYDKQSTEIKVKEAFKEEDPPKSPTRGCSKTVCAVLTLVLVLSIGIGAIFFSYLNVNDIDGDCSANDSTANTETSLKTKLNITCKWEHFNDTIVMTTLMLSSACLMEKTVVFQRTTL